MLASMREMSCMVKCYDRKPPYNDMYSKQAFLVLWLVRSKIVLLKLNQKCVTTSLQASTRCFKGELNRDIATSIWCKLRSSRTCRSKKYNCNIIDNFGSVLCSKTLNIFEIAIFLVCHFRLSYLFSRRSAWVARIF